MAVATEHLKEQFYDFIRQKHFPCTGAKTALNKGNIDVHTYHSIGELPASIDLLGDLYHFIDNFSIEEHMYSSFIAVFDDNQPRNDEAFERALWQQLQLLHDLDAFHFSWDSRVDNTPHSENFSFSLGENAFFIIGLNPHSARKSRRFDYPAIVFNLHSQFEKLREKGRFTQFRDHVRRRDRLFCGSANPMLANHGEDSEVYQYSGRHLEKNWQCPLRVRKQ